MNTERFVTAAAGTALFCIATLALIAGIVLLDHHFRNRRRRKKMNEDNLYEMKEMYQEIVQTASLRMEQQREENLQIIRELKKLNDNTNGSLQRIRALNEQALQQLEQIRAFTYAKSK